ncbi:MAG: 30S ribosomal protein S14 [Ignavibacteriales bacterium]|nr:MAG: 30S ribosomal protein S14 [Stygiobacter sp.]KAF0215049.1 MAG: 30S ribosomal protein [Ignavibacteria bacterium]MBI3123330.1 30S ribosomal protein S14 [Ignavibacteriales bacterium]OGU63313.1 MAG: 30S ribosomal protein S14 [Stygiobacter sp. GWC2_38_9]OGU82131.1 MAG: 30S ribosomal protein S14 [Stygiobacter sp. RIFOXYA12_FULL_38_9]OGV08874.1 MAG: 30S ribosomal protein S14 [Stygiobacter sp. RIFOXYB2_FULL_37_11]OGV15539.1 MAG: 30S ribosomal protein S14 [Stygiobacter sp. RIFOXYC2_FULL_38_25]
MARKSLLAREVKKRKLHAKYAEIRKELKEKGDYDALQLLPRNSSVTRLKNRCQMTGRPRAYYRKFGVSRLVLREMALRGEIPGLKKSSW